MKRQSLIAIFLSAGLSSSAFACPGGGMGTIYVDQTNTSGTYNGSSWATAFTTLEAALAVASSGNSIWVAHGTYAKSSASSYVLVSGVLIKGGFEGITPVSFGNGADCASLSSTLFNPYSGFTGSVFTGTSLGSGSKLERLSIAGGACTGDGGAIHLTGGQLEIESCGITSSATGNGGGIYADAVTLTLTTSSLGGNADGSGGSLYLDSCTLAATDSDFGGNADGDGGAIAIVDGSMTINNCEFTGTASNGGSIAADSTSFSISCSHFEKGIADYGEQLYVTGSTEGPTEITQTFFDNWYIGGTAGGGIFWNCDDSILKIDHSNLSGVYNLVEGSAIYVASGEVHVSNTTLSGVATNGGSIFVASGAIAMIQSSHINGQGSTYSDDGEAIYVAGGGAVNVYNSYMQGTPNDANDPLEIAATYVESGGTLDQRNCTVIYWQGYAVDAEASSTVTLYNNIFYFNHDQHNPGATDSLNLLGTSTISVCDVEGGAYAGCISADPQLEYFDFEYGGGPVARPLRTSPCFNSGDAWFLPVDSLDLNGNTNTTEKIPFDCPVYVTTNFPTDCKYTIAVLPRIFKCLDMGAFESRFPDYNHDQVIDGYDYLDFVDDYSNNRPAADYNGDSSVDLFDYLDFVDDYGATCI